MAHRPFAHPVTCCYEMLRKFETGQTFKPTTPGISFVLCSPKRSVTMFDPFVQLFQQFWGHPRALHVVSKVLCVVSFLQYKYTAGLSGSCCIRLQVA